MGPVRNRMGTTVAINGLGRIGRAVLKLAIGYTGGMNIGQEQLDGGKGFDSWRDTQLRIAGEGAALLQAVFMVDWNNAVGENPFSSAYFPTEATEPAAGDTAVQLLTSGRMRVEKVPLLRSRLKSPSLARRAMQTA